MPSLWGTSSSRNPVKSFIKKAKHRNGIVYWLVFWHDENDHLLYYTAVSYKEAKNRLISIRAGGRSIYGYLWDIEKFQWTIL